MIIVRTKIITIPTIIIVIISPATITLAIVIVRIKLRTALIVTSDVVTRDKLNSLILGLL